MPPLVWRAVVPLFVCLVVLGWPASASGEVTVLVLARTPARPSTGLVESLRIQLAKAATVRLGPSLSDPKLAARQQQARHLKQQSGAVLAIWVEPDRTERAGATALMLYLAGDGPEIDWRRLTAPAGPATDRAVALLVREALDSALAARAAAGADSGKAKSPGTGRPDAGRTGSPWAFVIDSGVMAAAPSVTADAQAGGLLSAGARFWHGPLLTELLVGTSVVSTMGTERPAGSLQISEIGVSLGGRALFATKTVAIGGSVEPSLRLLDVTGESPLGATGSCFRVVPALLVGPELRWLLHDNLHLRGSAGVQFALRRQRFAINDQILLDIGVARAVTQLSLVGSLP